MFDGQRREWTHYRGAWECFKRWFIAYGDLSGSQLYICISMEEQGFGSDVILF